MTGDIQGLHVLVSSLAQTARFLGPAMIGVAVWLVAIVFWAAGLSKLRQSRSAAMAFVDFRLLTHPSRNAAFAVGVLECGIGLWLVTMRAVGYAALAATILLWFFSFLLYRSLQRGDQFPCFCFGDRDQPISQRSLSRTFGLALLGSGLSVALLVGVVRPESSVITSIAWAALSVGVVGIYAVSATLPALVGLHARPARPGETAS